MTDLIDNLAKAVHYARSKSSPITRNDFATGRIWEPLRGTRLGMHLAEIGKVYGAADPELKSLTDRALRGLHSDGSGNEVYTAIRDRLKTHADTIPPPVPTEGITAGVREQQKNYRDRARSLVSAYNWHRIGHGLLLDSHLTDYVKSIAKPHIKGQELRTAASYFSSLNFTGGFPALEKVINAHTAASGKTVGFDKLQPQSPRITKAQEQVARFWNGFHKYLGDRMTTSYGAPKSVWTQEMMDRSLRRLSEKEDQREEVGRSNNPYKPPRFVEGRTPEGRKVLHWKDHLAALPGLPSSLSDKASKKRYYYPKDSVEQYTRDYADLVRYGLRDWFRPKAVVEPTVTAPLHGANQTGAEVERNAISKALQLHGISPDRLEDYVGDLREHLASPATRDDNFSRLYRERMAIAGVPRLANLSDLANAASPLVRFYGSKRGDFKPSFEPYQGLPPMAAELPEEPRMEAIAHHDFNLPEPNSAKALLRAAFAKVEKRTAKGLRSLKLRDPAKVTKPRQAKPDYPTPIPEGNLSPEQMVEAAYATKRATDAAAQPIKVPTRGRKPKPLPPPREKFARLRERLEFELDQIAFDRFLRGEVVKYGAYKAPAGGTVVDGVYYLGGKLIPNLQKFNRKKLSLAIRKLKSTSTSFGNSWFGLC